VAKKRQKEPAPPRKSVAEVLAALDSQLGPPAHIEDLSSIEHDCEVFVNRWCSLFGHRKTALKELLALVARVQEGTDG
jgi:hypothetical protein